MNLDGRWAARIGYVLSGLVILFMGFDAIIKLVPLDIALKATGELGFSSSETFVRGLGILALACTVLYAYPRTVAIGAVLLTGYLGGAVASQVRLGNPLFSHVLFGVYLGVMTWGGLFLRSKKLRAILLGREH